MPHGFRPFAAWFLTAALATPLTVLAQPAPSNLSQEQEEHRDRDDRNNQRYYDRDHRDYHNWDDREDHAYRRYLVVQRRPYRVYDQQNSRRQRNYWKWRHTHPDND